MPAETYVNIGGTPRQIGASGISAKVSGVWQVVNFGYANVAGVWQNVYIRDNSGPAAPTNCRATWNFNAIEITWTNPADADYAYMVVNAQPGAEPWILGTTVAAPGTSYHWTTDVKDNLIYTIQLTPVDSNGNVGTSAYFQTMAWTGAARGKTPSPTVFWPTDSGTWYVNGGYWRSDVSDRVIQGAFPGGEFIGMYFYGNQFYDLIRGTTISAASASFFRVNSGGTPFPVTPVVWGSTCVARPQNPVDTLYKGPITGPGLSLAGSPYPLPYNLGWTLPSTLFENMNSTAPSGSRFNAMGLWANDIVMRPDLGGGDVTESYMQMYSAYEYPYNIKSGAIAVDHSG